MQIAYMALKAEGPRGLYRGLPGIWTKEIPGSFVYFGSFEMAKSGLRHVNESPHLSKCLTSAAQSTHVGVCEYYM